MSNMTELEFDDGLGDAHSAIAKLATLAEPTRQFFAILLKRAHLSKFHLEASIPEIRQATNLTIEELREFVSILDHAGFINEGFPDEFGGEMVEVSPLQSTWRFWADIKEFCKAIGLDLAVPVFGLDFSSLAD